MCATPKVTKAPKRHRKSQSVPKFGPQVPSDIPVREWGKLRLSGSRYVAAFQSSYDIQDRIPKTEVPGCVDQVAYIIQAPLNSVEILEAILQPETPFQIHKASHIPQTGRTANDRLWRKMRYLLPHHQRLYREYKRFQGRLEKDREVSFVYFSSSSMYKLGEFYRHHGCSLVQAFYICLPWYNGFRKQVVHPWITVQTIGPGLGVIPLYTYEAQVRKILSTLGLPENCTFARSLLKPGEEPLPAYVLDWFRGIPGSAQALPYFEKLPSQPGGGALCIRLRPKLSVIFDT